MIDAVDEEIIVCLLVALIRGNGGEVVISRKALLEAAEFDIETKEIEGSDKVRLKIKRMVK